MCLYLWKMNPNSYSSGKIHGKMVSSLRSAEEDWRSWRKHLGGQRFDKWWDQQDTRAAEKYSRAKQTAHHGGGQGPPGEKETTTGEEAKATSLSSVSGGGSGATGPQKLETVDDVELNLTELDVQKTWGGKKGGSGLLPGGSGGDHGVVQAVVVGGGSSVGATGSSSGRGIMSDGANRSQSTGGPHGFTSAGTTEDPSGGFQHAVVNTGNSLGTTTTSGGGATPPDLLAAEEAVSRLSPAAKSFLSAWATSVHRRFDKKLEKKRERCATYRKMYLWEVLSYGVDLECTALNTLTFQEQVWLWSDIFN